MKEIKNREEIVEQLTDMLINFDQSLNQYQTDVYLYYDDETQTATLDTFINVGGNSWLDDDHYTIYHDTEYHDSWEDYFCNNNDFAQGLDMNPDDFDKEVMDFLELDDDEKEDYIIQWHEKRDYIRSREDYSDKLFAVYVGSIAEQRAEYKDRAEQIILDWQCGIFDPIQL